MQLDRQAASAPLQTHAVSHANACAGPPEWLTALAPPGPIFQRTRTCSRPGTAAPGGQHLSPLLLVSYTHRLRAIALPAHSTTRPTPWGHPQAGRMHSHSGWALDEAQQGTQAHTFRWSWKSRAVQIYTPSAGLKGWRAAADAVGRCRVQRATRCGMPMQPCHPFAQGPAAGAAPRPRPCSRLDAAGPPKSSPQTSPSVPNAGRPGRGGAVPTLRERCRPPPGPPPGAPPAGAAAPRPPAGSASARALSSASMAAKSGRAAASAAVQRSTSACSAAGAPHSAGSRAFWMPTWIMTCSARNVCGAATRHAKCGQPSRLQSLALCTVEYQALAQTQPPGNGLSRLTLASH